ncbi:MAG TPA: hypothetical protein VKT72_10880 [Candidatus Baltobacteraceae bacterium]|nr:hypothetical protein [Candidatus Baltobacteraceae bacterium]
MKQLKPENPSDLECAIELAQAIDDISKRLDEFRSAALFARPKKGGES